MKKSILAFFAILCLLSLSTLPRELSVRGNPGEIHVYPGPSAIQNAINSANPEDSIIVHTGEYYENIIVNKSISLVGEEPNLTTINGNRTGNVVTITADGVRLQNFTLKNSGASAPDSCIFVGTDNNNILDNIIVNNTYGIYVSSSYNNVISRNMIINNTHGITLSASYGNLLSTNVMQSNKEEGFFLSTSSNNIIFNNTITSQKIGTGMRLISSYGNNITANSITDNLNGVFILNSGNNVVYHNNFIENDQDAGPPDSGLINLWSFEDEGNYWSNYTGVDLNSDGIGDTPKTIDPANIDSHPLMGIFSKWQVALDSLVYNVAIISNSTISNLRFRIGGETGNRIISFDATGANGTRGFCRIKIAKDLMVYPYIVLIDDEEASPKLINTTQTHVISYLTYPHTNGTVTIISSEIVRLFYILQQDLNDLNATYNQLLSDFIILQMSLSSLNQTYYTILDNYVQLQSDLNSLNANYTKLQRDFDALGLSYQTLVTLNQSYYYLVNSYNILLTNYNLLQTSFSLLNSSYQEHLNAYAVQAQNNRNIAYIFTTIAAAFIITTVYFSKRVHTNSIPEQ